MNPIHVLLVEDNEGDVLLTTETLEEGGVAREITVARDGKAAIDLLEKTGIENPAAMPDLVLLDINLPKKNGQEVLRHIKASEMTMHTPVVILTTSSAEKDIMESYRNQASFYITKPMNLEHLMAAVSIITTSAIPGAPPTGHHAAG
jgi:CheY-like chemotaxis protein